VTFNTFLPEGDMKVEVLGHNGKVLEYEPDIDSSPKIKSGENGTEVSVMRAQRIYNDRQWPNPLTLKISGVAFKDK
jgi:alpha-L-fucosidase